MLWTYISLTLTTFIKTTFDINNPATNAELQWEMFVVFLSIFAHMCQSMWGVVESSLFHTKITTNGLVSFKHGINQSTVQWPWPIQQINTLDKRASFHFWSSCPVKLPVFDLIDVRVNILEWPTEMSFLWQTLCFQNSICQSSYCFIKLKR